VDLLALPDNTLTLAECVESLKRHELAWATLRWTREIDLALIAKHALSIQGNLISWTQDNADGNGLALCLAKLPSSLRHASDQALEYQTIPFDLDIPDQFGGPVVYYKIDLSQDLLVTIRGQKLVICRTQCLHSLN
jgi:hypothetical protein